MTTIRTTNRYTGRSHEWLVLDVTPAACRITVARPDWQTGEMVLTWKPSLRVWVNEYAGEVFVG